MLGARVRCQRLFRHWRQTPGTVVDIDAYFGCALIEFDSGVTRWIAIAILEAAI